MNADINQYLKLQQQLVGEKSRIEARLTDINRVLSGEVSVAAASPAPRGGKRTFSAATKAKMRAAQQARWAKIKGKSGSDAAPVAKKRRKMSAAGRAAIKAAQKERWAKVKPTTGKASK